MSFAQNIYLFVKKYFKNLTKILKFEEEIVIMVIENQDSINQYL